jgi:hypothetical protein
MSNLTSTTSMVTECQTRVPIGLSSTFWMKKLNEAFRWISQKGNYVWDIKSTSMTLSTFYFQLPTDCDPGKPMYLAGPTSGSGAYASILFPKSTIPYKPWDETLDQQYSEMVVPKGLFSCWTFTTAFVGSSYLYRAYLYPLTAGPTGGDSFTMDFAYHMDVSNVELALGANVYFPTPNSFDNLLIELAEAEARRIYGLAGSEMIQKRAESAIVNLLDSYRSTKNSLAGLTDQQKQVSEKKMMAQENT